LKFDLGAVRNQGLRDHMEDFYYFDTNFGGRSEIFGGVYDGHGGDWVAEMAKKELHRYFAKNLANGLKISEAFIIAYEEFSNKICSTEIDGGSCAASFFITNGRIYFANVGDVRILIVGSTKVEQITIDHHPNVLEEMERIKRFQGIIKNGKRLSIPFGSAANSRALGAKVVKNEKTASGMATSLVKAALDSGSRDNVTVLVVRFVS